MKKREIWLLIETYDDDFNYSYEILDAWIGKPSKEEVLESKCYDGTAISEEIAETLLNDSLYDLNKDEYLSLYCFKTY